MSQHSPSFRSALLAGGIAGTTVDLSLFPLDTLKTRLQSRGGFFASGGFAGIYRGVGSALVGSAPGAAFFFVTYEGVKEGLAGRRRRLGGEESALGHGPADDGLLGRTPDDLDAGLAAPLEHMAAASLGEIAACVVRVPTEVVKQRAQAGQHGGSSSGALTAILRQRSQVGLAGVWRELYRGWGITVMREVPFTVIQFPIWEAMKRWGRERRQRTGRGLFGLVGGDVRNTKRKDSGRAAKQADVGALESGFYGSVAGAVAAGVTTPLDVLKTRVMLAKHREKVLPVLRGILREHGIRPFFAGIAPRVMWISIGGAIFLGSYQWAVNTIEGTGF
jgi:solute carrier family 25 S-adenosylmethionine transporter 26